MRPDLLDAKAAIDWASAQLPILVKRIGVWRQSKPYTIVIDADSEPGKKLYRLANIKPLDPLIHAETGVILHSIRSSLDLLACALAARNGHPNSKSTHFPIWASEEEFLTNRDPRPLEKIKRLSDVHKGMVKALKPYPRGNDLLCALHELDLTRKHRRLLDAFILPRGIGFNPALRHYGIEICDWYNFKEEAILVKAAADVPDADVTIGLHVAFDEAGSMQGKSVTASISEFAYMAYSILEGFSRPGF